MAIAVSDKQSFIFSMEGVCVAPREREGGRGYTCNDGGAVMGRQCREVTKRDVGAADQT